jgi:CheY-like chemotaxis protein
MTDKQFSNGAANDLAANDLASGAARSELTPAWVQKLAHDINNPLTLMLFNLEELRRSCEESRGNGLAMPLIRETIEAAERIGEAARRLVDPAGVPARCPAQSPSDACATTVPTVTRVLVVDDEARLLRAIGRILARDHLVRCCKSALEALEYLNHETFDVILSDVVMPDVSGIEFRERVLARDSRYARRFLFMTGGTPAGAGPLTADVVHKPFTKAGIRDAIRSVVSRAAD